MAGHLRSSFLILERFFKLTGFLKLKIKVSHASTKIVAEFVGEAPRLVKSRRLLAASLGQPERWRVRNTQYRLRYRKPSILQTYTRYYLKSLKSQTFFSMMHRWILLIIVEGFCARSPWATTLQDLSFNLLNHRSLLSPLAHEFRVLIDLGNSFSSWGMAKIQTSFG